MPILTTRTRPKQYRCYLVRPLDGFLGRNWQDRPQKFSIISRVSQTPSLGKADAWRFMTNQSAIASGDFSTWAVWIASKG